MCRANPEGGQNILGNEMMRFFGYALIGTFYAFSAQAQPSLCGNPPPVDNETLKGDINGKAQFLSRFLGDASLGGKIETSRNEIFSRYKDANERSNAYFEYMVCLALMQDRNMTTTEKIDLLRRVRADFRKPIDASPAEETSRIKGFFARSDAVAGAAEGADARAGVSAESGWKIKRGSAHLVENSAFNASPILGKVEEPMTISVNGFMSRIWIYARMPFSRCTLKQFNLDQ